MPINYGDKIPNGSDLTTIVSYLQLLNNKVKELNTDLNTILQNEGVNTSKATRLEELINLVESEINSNKQKLADAIGEPVTGSDNIDEVCTKVDGLVNSFKTAAMNNGVAVESADKFKHLIDKLALLADSENKGLQMMSGKFFYYHPIENTYGDLKTTTVTTGLNFNPTLILVNCKITSDTYPINVLNNGYISNLNTFIYTSKYTDRPSLNIYILII